MKPFLLALSLAVLAFAFQARADDELVLADAETTIVALGSKSEIVSYDAEGARRWRVGGVRNPRSGALSPRGRVAIADPIAEEVVIVSADGSRSQKLDLEGTPIGIVFLDESLYVLRRDRRLLTRVGGNGSMSSVEVDAGGAFVRTDGERLFVYSRLTGRVQTFDGNLNGRGTSTFAPFASEMVTTADAGLLVYPKKGEIFGFSTQSLQEVQRMEVGAVPVAAAIREGNRALTAGIVAVADPSSKRVWTAEGAQSPTGAFTRGFIRGLLGLGLYKPSSSEFPTGVDRVWFAGKKLIAYDTVSRTLYEVRGRNAIVIARGIAPTAVAVSERGLTYWHGELVTR